MIPQKQSRLWKWSPSKLADPFSSQVINDQPLTKRGFFPFYKKKKNPREEVVLLEDGY